MLIRSNGPFQGGGNGQTQEGRALIDRDGRNGGWKQMVGCQESLPSCLTSFLLFTFSECELTGWSWETQA